MGILPFDGLLFQHPIELQRSEEQHGPYNCKWITYYDPGLNKVREQGFERYLHIHEATGLLLASLEGHLAENHRPIFNLMFVGYPEYLNLAWSLQGSSLIEAEDPFLQWNSSERYRLRDFGSSRETPLPAALLEARRHQLLEFPEELVRRWYGRSLAELPADVKTTWLTLPPRNEGWRPVMIGKTTREYFMHPPPDRELGYTLGVSVYDYGGAPRGVRKVA